MKYRFVDYDGRWYLIPAHESSGFLDLSYEITCAEDLFRTNYAKEAAEKWIDARRIFHETYGKYKIDVYVSGYTFENPQVENF